MVVWGVGMLECTCKKLVPLALGAPYCEARIHVNEPLPFRLHIMQIDYYVKRMIRSILALLILVVVGSRAWCKRGNGNY